VASVRETLVNAGVAPDRIATRGLGESYPVATNASQAGRQQNRRVEIILPPTPSTAGAGKQDEPYSGD
jgi:OOP family OmpA-OmpF porin